MKNITARLRRMFMRKRTKAPVVNYNNEYVVRKSLEDSIIHKIERGLSIVLYGPSQQGKTTLLSTLLPQQDIIYLECRPDFKRVHIYRLILSTMGYSLITQRKRRSKTTFVAKLNFLKNSLQGSESEEQELSSSEITIDLKNASEVAHLISKAKRDSYIVFNNFHLLKEPTKINLLYDLMFFIERAKLKLIIVGSWLNEDYLEVINPNLRSYLHYINVPYWEERELVEAYQKWNNLENADAGVVSLVHELNSICQGDIGFFRYINRIMESKLTLQAGECQNIVATLTPIVVSKLNSVIRKQLQLFISSRGIYFTYKTREKLPKILVNPEYDEEEDQPMKSTQINPLTNRPYLDGRATKVDSNNNPYYIEKEVEEVVIKESEIGTHLLRSFHTALNKSNKTSILLDDLIKESQIANSGVLDLSIKKLEAIYKRIETYQLSNNISPLLFAYDYHNNQIFVNNQKLTLFLKSVSEIELEEIIEDITPSEKPSPRKQNYISI